MQILMNRFKRTIYN